MRAKHLVLGAAAMIAVGLTGFATGVSIGQEKKTTVYELRTYTVLPGRLPALHKRFAEHTMKLFEKQGMRNGMYWVPTDDARKDNTHVAIARVEQIYPFPEDDIRGLLDRYASVREVCWVQEEPENMGAWEFARPLLETLDDGRHPLRYIGRSRNSSPSEGSSTWHAANQRAIVEQVFEGKTEPRELDRVLSKQV